MSERPRVLAVDDSATIRKAMELVLDPAEYDLELAANGSEALAKAKEFLPAVILLDFILPDMRGADVCQKLMEDPATASIPVVLISAKGAEIRQAYDNIPNVVSYITKPFTPAGVTSVIDEAIASTFATGSMAVPELVAPLPPAAEGLPLPAAERVSMAEVDVVDGANGTSLGAGEEEDYDIDWDVPEEVVPALRATPSGAGRAGLEAMFETLRGSLEGVFVEEGDTRAGAAADESMSYHELAARLERQVRETLSQTESGARHSLCSDGSIRSLDDSLLDTFRRFCRLLFRAAREGAMENELIGNNQPRVMFVCAREGDLVERLKSIAQERGDDWASVLVASNYRQLPLMARIFGPTHLVVEATANVAVWDQLDLVRRLPEGRRVCFIGVAAEVSGDGAGGRDTLAQRGIVRVLGDGASLPQALAQEISSTSPAPPARTERVMERTATGLAALA